LDLSGRVWQGNQSTVRVNTRRACPSGGCVVSLDEITLELAEALEVLSPFGAGNPSLVLATKAVTLKSVSPVGGSGEHLRLTVEDESGRAQSMMWWGGAGEELPEQGSRFDVAYSLRASTYRGQRQASLQFEEFRIPETGLPLEIRSPTVEAVDLRAVSDPAKKLAELMERSKSRDLGKARKGERKAAVRVTTRQGISCLSQPPRP
jgi:hypothetical protein